jgi:HSP20 family protein
MKLIRWGNELDRPVAADVFSLFDNLFRGDEVDNLGRSFSGWMPAVDIAEKGDAYVVQVELPGVNKDELKISMQENILTIRGEKSTEKDAKENGYFRRERSFGSFQRSFTLPEAVKGDKIDATMKDGVLRLSLPKAEEAKPKQVEIQIR